MGKSERLMRQEHTIGRCGFGPLGGCQYILLCIISTIVSSSKSSNTLGGCQYILLCIISTRLSSCKSSNTLWQFLFWPQICLPHILTWVSFCTINMQLVCTVVCQVPNGSIPPSAIQSLYCSVKTSHDLLHKQSIRLPLFEICSCILFSQILGNFRVEKTFVDLSGFAWIWEWCSLPS